MEGQGRAGQCKNNDINNQRQSLFVISPSGGIIKGSSLHGAHLRAVFYHALPIPPRTPATAAAIKPPPPRHHHHSTLLRIRRILLVDFYELVLIRTLRQGKAPRTVSGIQNPFCTEPPPIDTSSTVTFSTPLPLMLLSRHVGMAHQRDTVSMTHQYDSSVRST